MTCTLTILEKNGNHHSSRCPLCANSVFSVLILFFPRLSALIFFFLSALCDNSSIHSKEIA